MTPKWQRARISADVPDWKETVGSTLWTKVGPPTTIPEWNSNMFNETIAPLVSFETNLFDETGEPLRVTTEFVELLPDFADDVPLIPWEQFLAECRAKERIE